MNEEETKTEKVETNPQGGETEQVDPITDGGGGQGAPTCNLYRWYPPLLVLSTVMAGFFCVLYVTKPVFLEAPNQSLPDPLNVPVFAEQIAKADAVPAQPSGKALLPVHLDPDLSAGPGESAFTDELSGGIPAVSELKPLQVQKPSKPLFQPMDPDKMPPSVPPKAVAVELAPMETAPEVAAAENEPSRAIAVTESAEEAPDAGGVGSSVDEAVAMASAEELEAVEEDLMAHPVGHPTDDPGDEFEGDVLVEKTDDEKETQDEELNRIVMRASLLGEFYSGDGVDETGAGRSLRSTKVIALQEEE